MTAEITDTKPWIVVVGGFLGAGKTTLILAAARELERLGQRCAVILNDQGSALVDTELVSHLCADIRQAAQSQTESIEPLRPEDIADAIAYIITRERRVAVNEILVRAAEQTW